MTRTGIRKGPRRFLIAWTVIFCLCAMPRRARAEGTETTMRADDFEVTVDSRWTGGEIGGYYPVRVRVTNHGPTRDLRFVIESQEQMQNLRVERSVNVPQNAVAKLTLSIPMVAYNNYSTLRVHGPGGEIRPLRQTITLSSYSGVQQSCPALLVVSSKIVDFIPWQHAMSREVISNPGTGYYPYGSYSYMTSSNITNQQTVSASSLPDNWIDYTALDILAIPLDDFATLTNEQRSAIRQWVHAGGTLLLTNVGAWEQSRTDVDRLLELNQMLARSAEWTAADMATRANFKTLQSIKKIEEAREPRYSYPSPASPEETTTAEQPDQAPATIWNEDSPVFHRRYIMLGEVYAFRDDPFPGSDPDWAWFMSHRGRERNWEARHGFTTKNGHQEFMQFLIPGISQVPVTAFLIMISAFAIVIGPINYIYFLKRKQLAMIVVSIPLIAFTTSLSLFGYTVISHGFNVKSRVQSMTLIDQRAQKGITFSRNSLYTGFAPSDGLEFSPQTAVFPLWNAGQEFEKGFIDWTDGQRFYSGWLPSRTKTQFMTINYHDERARLTVHSPVNGTLTIENGFEQQLDALCVRASDEQYYIGFDIPAGAKAELKLLDPESRQKFEMLRARNTPSIDPRYTSNAYNSFDYRRMSRYGGAYGYYGMANNSTATFNMSGIHRLFQQKGMLINAGNVDNAGQNIPYYFGIYSENPGVDLGIDDTDERASQHFVIGYYE